MVLLAIVRSKIQNLKKLLPILISAVIPISILSLMAIPARAEILFEGYSKVLLSGQSVGYTIVRYEFDPKKKEFVMTSMLRTNQKGGNINESLKARSGSALKPISYQYTGLLNGKAKTIDATFPGDEMVATVREGDKSQVIKKKLPKGAFLSSFLAYLMLQGKEGIKPGIRYGYQAIAEEDATLNPGEAFVEKEEVLNGISTFRVLNLFKGTRFVSNVTAKGEVLATNSPVEQIATELVASQQDATAGESFNSNSVKTLFGSIPKGVENAVARRTSKEPGKDQTIQDASKDSGQTNRQAVQPEPKKHGVPQGMGLTLKGAAPKDTATEGTEKKNPEATASPPEGK